MSIFLARKLRCRSSNTPILLTKLTLWSPVMTQQKLCFVTFRKRLSNFHVPTYVTLQHNSWNADCHLNSLFLCTLKDSNLQFSSALMLFHVVCAIFCFGIVFDKADCANAFLTIWIACERTILPLLFWSLYFCICQSVFCSAIRSHWADNTVWLAKAFRKSTAFGTEYEPPADDKSAQIYWVFDHFRGFLQEVWKTCLLLIKNEQLVLGAVPFKNMWHLHWNRTRLCHPLDPINSGARMWIYFRFSCYWVHRQIE